MRTSGEMEDPAEYRRGQVGNGTGPLGNGMGPVENGIDPLGYRWGPVGMEGAQ
jgi:hypothetical protein